MLTNIDKKFKDRDPKETTAILINFFNKYNFTLKFHYINNSVGTYSSHVTLLMNDVVLLRANGKGTSEEFSKASALAELYERFCNKLWIPYSQLYRLENLSPKITNSYEIIDLDSAESITKLKKSIYYGNEDLTKYILSKFSFNNKFRLTKYININNKEDTKYLNHLGLAMAYGTTGMAAGNSINEALVQCISELFERIAVSCVVDNPNQTFYRLNTDDCSEYLKEIIDRVSLHGKLDIIDLSFNTDMPVLMALFFNRKTNSLHYNFSSAPVKDIAVERLLTELYQGVEDDDGFMHMAEFQLSSHMFSKNDIKEGIFSHCCSRTFPEQIISNICDASSCSNIFLKNGEYSNEFLLDYIKNTMIRNNLNVYFTDVSLIDEVKAVHIYCQEFCNNKFNPLGEMSEIGIYDYIDKLYKLYENICKTKTLNYNEVASFLMYVKQNTQVLFKSRKLSPFPDTYPALYSMYDTTIRPEVYFNQEFKNSECLNDCFNMYISNAKMWLEIYNYLVFTNTSPSDIIKYYKNYIPNITEQDVLNTTSREFVIVKSIFEPFLNSVIDTSLDNSIKPFLEREVNSGGISS